MRCLTRTAALLTLCLALGPAMADDTKNDKKPAPTSSGDYTTIGEVTGALAVAPDEKGNSISLRFNQLTIQNGGAGYQLLRGKSNLKVKEAPKDYPLELTSDVKVRRLHLPPKIDDKGKKVAYTEKELKELKGDSNLRGFEASMANLHAGTVVTLHLVKMKGDKSDPVKPHVNRIYIVSDGPAAGDNKDKKGEKK